jgi:transposase
MIGIDVSKNNLVCTHICPLTRKQIWQATFPNTPQGIAKLLSKGRENSSYVLEPTGRYGDVMVQKATEAGYRVLLAPPKRAKSFLSSVQSRAKTDRLDSGSLALFALSVSLSPYPRKSPVVETVTQLLSARKGLTQSMMRLRLQQKELPHAAAPLEAALVALSQQVTVLDEQIASASQEEEALSETRKRLLQVPGVGPVTAAAVGACLVSKEFVSPDAFIAYCGLDISVRQSGKRSGDLGLSRQGNAELRRLLYLCAQSTLRVKDSPFKEQYERERAKGLASTAALCAVSRKMAKLCWSLWKHNSDYDASRVYQQKQKQKQNQKQKPANETLEP